MKNIELKVALGGFEDLIKALKKIQAQYQGALDQVDTYFNCQFGRLKLREINKQSSEIIHYQRPDKKIKSIGL